MVSRSLSLLQRGFGSDLTQSLSLPYLSGAFATGVAKLLQNVVAELLTLRGSVRFDPQYGCNLVNQIGVTNVSSLSDVNHLINVAVIDVQDNMRRRIIGDEPLDEMLDRIVVERLQQELDSVKVFLRVYSRAGESVSHHLPITF